MRGKVKWWIPSKGYGFIQNEQGDDIFVHYTDVNLPGRKNLEEGQAVTFTLKETPKGPRATQVLPVETSGASIPNTEEISAA